MYCHEEHSTTNFLPSCSIGDPQLREFMQRCATELNHLQGSARRMAEENISLSTVSDEFPPLWFLADCQASVAVGKKLRGKIKGL